MLLLTLVKHEYAHSGGSGQESPAFRHGECQTESAISVVKDYLK